MPGPRAQALELGIERDRIDPGDVREVRAPIGDATRVRARLVLRAYRAQVIDALDLDPSAAPEVVVLESESSR